MIYINYNGQLVEENTPIIIANNRGLRYGDGLFETIKFKNNTLFFIDDHLARLWNGMKLLQFDIPKLFTPDFLENQILHLIQKNNYPAARVRLTIIKGKGGLYDARNHSPKFIIECWPLPASNGLLNENGLHCCIYYDALKPIDNFSNCKHNNYLPYTMGALFAKNKKCNDAIILNHKQHICDSTIANIFLIKEDTIITPPLSEGCVAGVLRHFIIKELIKLNYKIIEAPITTADLLEADEVFLSNSIYNIRWVSWIEDKSYQNTLTQKIYFQLAQTNSSVFC